MAELLPFQRPEYRPTTLDEVWQEAETLGEVSIRACGFGKKYEATISFKSRFGRVYAEAKHDSVLMALGDAINNARQMGAGEAL